MLVKYKDWRLERICFADKPVTLKGYLENSPVEKTNSCQSTFVTKISKYRKERFLIYFSRDSIAANMKAGDVIKINGTISKIRKNTNPAGFDYQNFMRHKGILYSCYVGDNFELMEKKEWNLYTISQKIRGSLLSLFHNNLKDQEIISVLSAITLGYKEDLSPETKRVFSETGSQHILAVSGLHVGIIYMILSLLTYPLKKRNLLFQTLIIIMALWAYAFITGLGASVIRASLMFSVFALGKPFKRHLNGINNLAFAAFVILLFNPFQIYDIGFQLSFLAMAGILLFYPRIYPIYEAPNWIVNHIWQIIAISVSVQISLLPVILFNFHQFPLYFLLTNILILDLAMIVVCVALIFFLLATTPLAGIISKILSGLMKLFLFIIKTIYQLPNSTVENIHLNTSQVLLLYSILIATTLFLIIKRSLFLKTCMVGVLFLVFSFTVEKMASIKQAKMIVFDFNGTTALDFINGRKAVLITMGDMGIYSENIVNEYHGKNRIENTIHLKDSVKDIEFEFFKYLSPCFINFMGNKNVWLKHKNEINKMKNLDNQFFDFMIVSNNMYFDLEDVKCRFGKIILDSSNTIWNIKKWKALEKKLDIDMHFVKEEGAFELEY